MKTAGIASGYFCLERGSLELKQEFSTFCVKLAELGSFTSDVELKEVNCCGDAFDDFT